MTGWRVSGSWVVVRCSFIVGRGSLFVGRGRARYRPAKHERGSHNVLNNSNHYLRGSGEPVAEYSYFVGLTQQFQQHDHALFTVLLGENGFHAGKRPVRQFDPGAACSKRHTSSPSPRVPTDVAERRKGQHIERYYGPDLSAAPLA